jgi:hypothetical protein
MSASVTDEELRRGVEALRDMGFEHPERWLEGAEGLRKRIAEVAPPTSSAAANEGKSTEEQKIRGAGKRRRGPERPRAATVWTAEVVKLNKASDRWKMTLRAIEAETAVEEVSIRLRRQGSWSVGDCVQVIQVGGTLQLGEVVKPASRKTDEASRATA